MDWLVLLLCLSLCSLADSEGHDGGTVTAMLARLGLGPGAASEGCEDGEEDVPCLRGVGPEVEEVAKDLCWGYEKDCSKDKRLFVPTCSGSATPW